MLSRLRIGPKLWLAPGIVLVLLSLLSIGAYRTMVRQNAALETNVRQNAEQARAADELAVAARRVHAQAYQVLAWYAGGYPARRVAPLIADLHKQLDAVERGLADLPRSAAPVRAGQGADPTRAAWRAYVTAVSDAIDIGRYDESIGTGVMGKADAALALVAQRLGDVARYGRMQAAQAAGDAADEVRLFSLLVPFAIVLAGGAALAVTLALRRGLLADAGAIDAAAAALAGGDFTARSHAYGDDEVGQAGRRLDAGVLALNGTMRTVLEAARAIGASSREVVLGRAAMPARAGTRDALERATAPIRTMAGELREGAARARAANGVAEDAMHAARQGADAVHRVLATLDEVRGTALRLEALGAAIEAASARAAGVAADGGTVNGGTMHGETGGSGRPKARGRDALAADAAAREALAAAREARVLARDAAATAGSGGAWAAEAGARLAELTGATRDAGATAARIADADAAHARELAGIDQAIMRMDAMSREHARMVEDAALAARGLQAQALVLSRTVASFRLDEVVPGRARWHETTPPGVSDGQPGGLIQPYLHLVKGPR